VAEEFYERLTTSASRAVKYAQDEARRMGSSTVGTEHVLLGLVREGEGVAARVLELLGVSLGRLRAEVAQHAGTEDQRTPGHGIATWSAKAKRALELSMHEAMELNPRLGLPNYIDTEHILLAVLRDAESAAVRVLIALGVEVERLRQEVLKQLRATPVLARQAVREAAAHRLGAVHTSRPTVRPRRLRATPAIRRLVAETNVTTDRLILPLFAAEGQDKPVEIESLPGHMRWAPEQIAKPAREAADAGIPAVLIFGLPASKDETGSEAYNPAGVVQKAVAQIKRQVADLIVITDVCLCQYTSHGHCGLVSEAGEVLNDATLDLVAKTALSHAQAGADIVAPSGMMDGTVRAIREVLDESGFQQTAIMAYSAKYASAFYGPFREAADSAPQFGDRRSYQLDPRNAREAVREVALDVAEGADIVMIKPALAYLDVIRRVSASVNIPLAAYNVSGEYGMVKAAVAKGWMDERGAAFEILNAIRRAGADMIITYHAKDVAKWLAG